MEQKNRIMDTVITGAIMIACFAIPFFILDPQAQLPHKPLIKELVYSNNNLLAKWVAIGVFAHILGSIVAVIAICLIQRPFENEPARQFLRDEVSQWIATCSPYSKRNKPDLDQNIYCSATHRKIEDTIKNLDPDSIWAWIHYSDSRKELVDWGRRKLHYAYLAENWMIAIVIGEFLGFSTVIYTYTSASSDSWRIQIAFAFIFISIAAVVELWVVRKKNIDWDNDMVAIYIAARRFRKLEDRFLPSLTREKEIQTK
jgi:hypothetical protein